MTGVERRLALRAFRAIVPDREGFRDPDLAAAIGRLEAHLPRRGALAFRAAVVLAAALEPTFGARDRSRYFAALLGHRLPPLRQLGTALKGLLFLGARP